MVEVHECICDKCNRCADMVKHYYLDVVFNNSFNPPSGWSNINGKLLCVICTRSYNKAKEELFSEWLLR